jgi:hypothetical protein
MGKSLLFRVSVVLILASCSTNAKLSTSEEIIFSYEKTACMGSCPVYKFTLYSGGYVEFEGIKHIKPIGMFSLNLSEPNHKKIIQLIESSNLSQYEPSYTGNVTDLPTTKIRFTTEGTDRAIIDYYGAPQSLKSFEKELETLILSISWK